MRVCEPMAMQPAIARQNGRGVWLYKRPLRCHISDFFSSVTENLPCWFFADAMIRRWNASAAGLDLSQWPAYWFGLTIVTHEPQSTLVKNRPAASIGIGQASRRPAGPIHQPGLPGIWPNASKVVLKPRLGYVPKVLSSPFRAQVIALSTLSLLTGSQELSLLCPVRALRVYIECSASYRKSEQLFVGFGNRAKGGPVTKQGISRWLVDAITLAYSSLGL